MIFWIYFTKRLLKK